MLSSAQPTCFLIADISGLHRLPRRRRARPRAGHPGRPDRRGRHGAAAELPAGQARGRRRLHLRDRPSKIDGIDAARHDRALLLRVPPAPPRRPPGDLVRVQRLRPDPRPQPQVRGPPRLGDPAEGRRPRGAARLGRDRRPPTAQERRRRDAGHRGLRAHQPGRASTPSDIDPAALEMRAITETYDRIGDVPCWVARPRAAMAGGGGPRSGSSSRRTTRSSSCRSPTRRAAAGRLGVPDGARPRDDLAAGVTDVIVERRHRRPPRAGSPPTTACTARTRSSRRSSTGGRTTTSPTGRSSHTPTAGR